MTTSLPAQQLMAQRPAVLRFLRRVTGDEAQAADLTQETMVEALNHVSQWRGEGSGRAWLLAIARNKVHHARRAASVAQTVSADDSIEALGLDAGWGTPADPETLSAQLEERQLLERALTSLGHEAREILTLRELEGLSGDETAQTLGLTVPAMKSRLHRARLELVAAVKRQLAPRERTSGAPHG